VLWLVGNIIQFRFDVGNGIQTLEKMTAYPLNDNFWHLVHIERNRKQAMLRIDQQAAVLLDEPTDQHFRTLNLDSPLVIGTIKSWRYACKLVLSSLEFRAGQAAIKLPSVEASKQA